MKTKFFLSALAAVIFFTQPGFSAEKKVLKWGGDSEGGAPFVFQDPKDPSKTIGFEVDFVQALADEMGMTPEFVQNQWDGLIPGLKRGNYDIIVNGLEITDDRKQEVHFSDPYYLTYEQITVRKENYDIHRLSDLKGRTVGTLKYSLAERILEGVGGVQVRGYDSQTTIYEDLANGRTDAVLLDHPIAIYYGDPDRRLKSVGKPVGQMAYGIGIRKGDGKLLVDVNAALARIKKSGKLRQIYERWGIWNSLMAEDLGDTSPSATRADQYDAYLEAIGQKRTWKDQLKQYLSYIPLLAKGAVTTIELSVLGMAFAVVLGLFIALVRLYAPAPIALLGVLYVEIIRGTPLLIQLFFIFYGLPNIGIKLSPFVAAVLGLALNYAAYEAEVYRAGILSIPKSQMDAAFALGMNRRQSLRHVIVPQAMRVVIPPMTNDFISLLKDSSLVSVITMVELTKVYGQLASTYYDYFGIGLLAAAMYLLIGLPFVHISRVAEKHFSKSLRRV